jgi:hypothetical protein
VRIMKKFVPMPLKSWKRPESPEFPFSTQPPATLEKDSSTSANGTRKFPCAH